MKVLHEIINFDAQSKPGVVIIRVRATALQEDGTPYQWTHTERRWVGKMERVKKKIKKPIYVETKKGAPKMLEYVDIEVDVDERKGSDVEIQELRSVTAEAEIAEPHAGAIGDVAALSVAILGRRRIFGKSIKDHLTGKLQAQLLALNLLAPDPSLPKIDKPMAVKL